MSVWNYTPKMDMWTGVVVAAGLIAAPVVLPIVADAVRPLIKGVFKGVLVVYDTGLAMVSDTLEGAQGLLEEVRAEIRAEASE